MSQGNKNFQSQVAQHYNQVEQKSVRERKKSDIIDLRKFNNAMKSLMHHMATKFAVQSICSLKGSMRVLDLGCGKGGDLPKYLRNSEVAHVVGVDIADVSIQQCKERFRSMRPHHGRKFKGDFFVADLTREDISKKLQDIDCTEKFHVASSQFSIHYSFESFDQAVRYIENAAKNLTKHGLFIGTYPDGPKLIKSARNSETPGVFEVDDILRVEFAPEDLKNPKPFGTKYHFKLKEVVDCPEFLVHPQVLRALFKSLGFYEVFDRSFEEQLREAKNNIKGPFTEIFSGHDAFDIDYDERIARLGQDMWRAASIYRCFCYRKARDD